MKQENKLRDKFKKEWLKTNPFFQKIEPQPCCDGLPDCLLVSENRKVIWIELKYLEKPFKEMTLPIRQSQKLWLLKYPDYAGILIQVGKIYYLFDKEDIKLLTLKKLKWEVFEHICRMKSKNLENISSHLSNIS